MESYNRKIVEELHQISRKNFPRRKIIVREINEIFAADLADMNKYKRFNKQYRYFLLVIDVFSKFVICKALKNKKAETIYNAFEEIFKTRKPKYLWVDQGTEFYNSKMKKLLEDYKVKMYHTFTQIKSGVAERAIRTIKSAMGKNFSIKANDNWIDDLDIIVEKYNNTKHSTTGYAPIDVNEKNSGEIKERVYEEHFIPSRKKEEKFKINDVVRISLEKKLFEKAHQQEWSTEFFIIHDIKYTRPVTYILKDLYDTILPGRFYKHEIMKSKYPHKYLIEKILEEKDGMVHVKWNDDLGSTTWEKKEDL